MSRAEQCCKNAQAKSERKRCATFAALAALQQEKRAITKAAVARRAGVSVVFLRKHQDLLQAVEEAEQKQPALRPTTSHMDLARDQVIAALQRRLDDMKQRLTATEVALREKQQECDQLYGKLAVASPLTDSDLRSALTDTLERLRRAEEQCANG
jgi:hypothetical protein